MEYTLVMVDTAPALERRVNELIGEGWEPQGGVAVTITQVASSWSYSFVQALIKRAPQD